VEISDRRQRVEVAAEVVEVGHLTSDQQLGLRQAEERLHRDYIHRLLKVTHIPGHYLDMKSL